MSGAIKLSHKRVSTNGKVKMQFDVSMLNTLIKYALKENLSKTALNNLYNLFDKIDIENLDYNQQIQEKARLVKLISEARALQNVHEPEVIKAFILNNNQDLKDACDDVTWEYSDLTASISKMLSTNIDERLQYIYIFEAKDQIMKAFDKMNTMDFISYHEIVEDLRAQLSQLMVKIQNTTVGTGMMRKFSFSDDDFFEEMVDIIVRKSKKSTYILQTGMRQMNAILSPGFYGGRFYVYLGMSGKFKSGTLLNLADQIRKFNPQIKAVEDGKRKCVLFVTMENSINSSVEYKAC